MGILPRLYNENEIKYQRKQFQETLDVQGILVRYDPISRNDAKEDAYDFYNDVIESEDTYGDPIKVRILFEVVPQVRTLNSLGWYIEDGQLPYLAYIPTEYLDTETKEHLLVPEVDDTITLLDGATGGVRSTRKYRIKDLRSVGYPDPIYHIAKLVPVYENSGGD